MNMDMYAFSGNVGRDAEMRYTPQGQAVLNFSVAVNRGWFDQTTKEWKDRVEWVRCALWGESAERKAGQIVKGVYVVVSGRPSVNAYIDKDGKAAGSLEVRVDNIDIIRRAANGEQAANDAPEPAGEGVLDF